MSVASLVAEEGRVAVGQVYDLTVRFGNQTRAKCLVCTRFIKGQSSPGRRDCSCGTQWEPADQAGLFRVVSLP